MRKLGVGLIILVACLQCAAQSGPPASDPITLAAPDPSVCPTPYSATTVAQHLACFDKSVWEWQTAAEPAATVFGGILLKQWFGLTLATAGYPNSWPGREQHYGANLAGDLSGKFFGNFLMPSIFHEDPQYQPLTLDAVWYDRAEHVADHLIHTRSNHLFNLSAWTTFGITAALSNLYVPQRQRTIGQTSARAGLNAAGFLAGDAFTEFEPDLKCIALHAFTLSFRPCERIQTPPRPPDATVNYQDLVLPRQQTLSQDFHPNQPWEKVEYTKQLEFAGATQALSNWCVNDRDCSSLAASDQRPGLDQVSKVTSVFGQDPSQASACQFNVKVTWNGGADQRFVNGYDWSYHPPWFHPGEFGYDQNKDGDSFLGLVVLFDEKEKTPGQFHIGFQSLFSHLVPENSNIEQNYALYCRWYGQIKNFYTKCPPKPQIDPLVQLATFAYVSRPPRTDRRHPAATEAKNNTPQSLDAVAKGFLTAWLVERADYSTLRGYIAKDNAFAYKPVKWEMQTSAWHRTTEEDAWRQIFSGAFLSTGPQLRSLGDAIEFRSPAGAGIWVARGYFSQAVSSRGNHLYAIYNAIDPPRGVFFPKATLRGRFLSRSAPVLFDARARYLDHLQRTYFGRVREMPFAVMGPGLRQEGMILYWILEDQNKSKSQNRSKVQNLQWKLAAIQGTD